LLQLKFIINSGTGTAWGHWVRWIIWTGSSCKCRNKCGYFDSKGWCSGSISNSINMSCFSGTSVFCWWVYYHFSCTERLWIFFHVSEKYIWTFFLLELKILLDTFWVCIRDYQTCISISVGHQYFAIFELFGLHRQYYVIPNGVVKWCWASTKILKKRKEMVYGFTSIDLYYYCILISLTCKCGILGI
jgi:hypothetical protein